MNPLDAMVEERIQAARRDGAFDNLSGQGKPLVLDDDRLIPEELRAGYRLLKNSGYLPAELQLHRELKDTQALLRQSEVDGDTAGTARARARLALLEARMEAAGKRPLWIADAAYRQRLEGKLG